MTTEDRRALFEQSTDRVGINLVKISGNGIDPLYLCQNSEAVVSRGQVYSPAPIEVILPEKGIKEAQASLKISGLELAYIEMVQSADPSSEITVESAYIFSDAADDYLDGPYLLKVNSANVEASTGTIELSLVADQILDYFVSIRKYDNKDFPAIWV